MSYCPNCKATLGGKVLRCPECGHERQPEPETEDQADGEPKRLGCGLRAPPARE
jgi:hypothetical protein